MHDGTEYAAGCRGRAEIEAESVAYIVCHAAGLTTAAYSFGYVAHWSGGDPATVKDTAERVVTTARTISTGPDSSPKRSQLWRRGRLERGGGGSPASRRAAP